MLRSNSYDSDGSGDPTSPMTPSIYDPARASLDAISASSSRYVGMISNDRMYDEYPPPTESCTSSATKRIVDTPKASSCDEDGSANTSSAQERPGRRYPCRFRDTHGCDKTFTTSGHASRHSKIHTAEKAVHCTYPNCHKKFTRADNMEAASRNPLQGQESRRRLSIYWVAGRCSAHVGWEQKTSGHFAWKRIFGPSCQPSTSPPPREPRWG